jgi:two-component system, NarL family, sensor histidine kinase UhpB
VARRYVPLFWRLFIPNATVLCVACVVLIVEPANGRVVALVGGLTVMIAVNLLLIRSAVAPLTRLTNLMRDVDPLRPGQRLPAGGRDSEVTLLADAFNEMLDRLEVERRESGRKALAERETERRRLAGELHDEIGQSLTALALQLDRVRGRAPDELRQDVADARDAALATVDEVRALVRRLRPEALDALGLVPALVNLMERWSAQTGVRITRDFDGELPSLSPEAELVLYRVVQESLTNVVRHSQATTAHVGLHARDGIVRLSVRDDGAGMSSPPDEAAGIRGMRERAMLVGGRIDIRSAPAGGTEVRLELPRTS